MHSWQNIFLSSLNILAEVCWCCSPWGCWARRRLSCMSMRTMTLSARTSISATSPTCSGTGTRASKSSIRRFVITEKAPTKAFSWLKAATTAFTFKTLLRHYAKQALTPRSLNVKLGSRRKGHKGRGVR